MMVHMKPFIFLLKIFIFSLIVIGILYLWLMKDLVLGKGCGGPNHIQCQGQYICWSQQNVQEVYGHCVYEKLEFMLPTFSQLKFLSRG